MFDHNGTWNDAAAITLPNPADSMLPPIPRKIGETLLSGMPIYAAGEVEAYVAEAEFRNGN